MNEKTYLPKEFEYEFLNHFAMLYKPPKALFGKVVKLIELSEAQTNDNYTETFEATKKLYNKMSKLEIYWLGVFGQRYVRHNFVYNAIKLMEYHLADVKWFKEN